MKEKKKDATPHPRCLAYAGQVWVNAAELEAYLFSREYPEVAKYISQFRA